MERKFGRSFSAEEEDDYWGHSTASNSKSLFSEDGDEWENTKKLKDKLRQTLPEEGEADVINWDGSLATSNVSVGYSVAKYKPPSPASSTSSASSGISLAVQRALQPPGGNSGPTQHSTSQFSINQIKSHNRSSSLTTGGVIKEDLSRAISQRTIDDVVTSVIPKQPKVKTEETINLERQIQCLQRNLQSEKRKHWEKPNIENTVRRLVMGEPYSLEMFRSKDDKLKLLNKAIATHDGNAILTIILFLKSTLKPRLFNQEVLSHPSAVNHYLSYLKEHYDFNELIDLLARLGHNEEAAMLKYKQAISVKNIEAKIRGLQTCYRTHFQSDVQLANDAKHVSQQVALLERQLPIDKDDERMEADRSLIFVQYPRRASLCNTSVLTTLYYCCFYHYDLPENSLASPVAIRKAHSLTDKQFMWTTLNALSRLKKWTAIETLFSSKGWFGTTKMKSVIGFDKVVEVLHKNKSPSDVMGKYLKLIDDQDKRLELAFKFTNHIVVIDTLVSQKDRTRLFDYQSTKITPHTKEYYYAQDALRNSSIKWKN